MAGFPSLKRRLMEATKPEDVFGQLEVFVIDSYDIVLRKLFSQREKDRDDLRVLAPVMDKNQLVRRLRKDATALAAEPWRKAACGYELAHSLRRTTPGVMK